MSCNNALVLTVVAMIVLPCVAQSALNNLPSRDSGRVHRLTNWFQRIVPGGGQVLAASSIDADTIAYALVIRVHVIGQENIAIALLISRSTKDNFNHYLRSMSSDSSSEFPLPALCSVLTGDVGYISQHDSLSTIVPSSFMSLMLRADTSTLGVMYKCDFTAFDAVDIALYDVDEQSQRFFYADSKPVFESKPLELAVCLSFQRMIEHIVFGPMLQVLCRVYRHERSVINRGLKPIPKFTGPPIEVNPYIPPKNK